MHAAGLDIQCNIKNTHVTIVIDKNHNVYYDWIKAMEVNKM